MLAIHEIQKALNEEVLDKKLSHFYCRPAPEIQPYKERIKRLLLNYQEHFGHDIHSEAMVFSSPGRTELGGNHTDHQGGKVLTGSVDLDALACAAPNDTPVIRIFSEGYGEIEVDTRRTGSQEEETHTAKAIVRGIAAEVCRKGYSVSGLDVYITSDVPAGSGLSSSPRRTND